MFVSILIFTVLNFRGARRTELLDTGAWVLQRLGLAQLLQTHAFKSLAPQDSNLRHDVARTGTCFFVLEGSDQTPCGSTMLCHAVPCFRFALWQMAQDKGSQMISTYRHVVPFAELASAGHCRCSRHRPDPMAAGAWRAFACGAAQMP